MTSSRLNDAAVGLACNPTPMNTLLQDPMVQAGFAPFAVALLVAALTMRLRPAGWAWLAVPAALATTLALSTGLTLTPLTAARKALLVLLLAPFVGLALDLARVQGRGVAPVLAVALLGAGAWAFGPVLMRAEGSQGLVQGAGLLLFGAAVAALNLRLRADGTAAASGLLAQGVALGVAAVLSASIGNLMNGLAVAMGGAALLVLHGLRGGSGDHAAGWAGALAAAAPAVLLPATVFVLADLRWPVLLALPLVPLVAALPLFESHPPRRRLVLRALSTAAAALPALAAAWFTTAAA